MLFFVAASSAQSNTPSQDVADPSQPVAVDPLSPAEPAYVIGDDGQKIYFITKPVIKGAENAVKTETPSQRSNNEQPARKPE